MKVFLLLLGAVSTLAVPLEQSKPKTLKDVLVKPSSAGLRIVDGNPAVLGQFPWQVAILTINGAFCGGSLISNEWVLTIAQCAMLDRFFLVYMGTVVLEPGRSRLLGASDTAVLHPDFNNLNLNNNIALLKLGMPVPFTDNIQSVKLPVRGDIVGVGVPATASGWGSTTDDDYSRSEILNYVELTTISNAECEAVYGSSVVIDSTLCAVGNPSHGPCFGDFGGPFVTFDENGVATQVGVISFITNQGCGNELPSGYVRTEPYLDWIAQETGLDL